MALLDNPAVVLKVCVLGLEVPKTRYQMRHEQQYNA